MFEGTIDSRPRTEAEVGLPAAHRYVLQPDELDLVDGDVGNFVLGVDVLLHRFVFLVLRIIDVSSSQMRQMRQRSTHLEETQNRLRDVLRQLRASDGHRWATEIPGRDLTTPRGVPGPLKTASAY